MIAEKTKKLIMATERLKAIYRRGDPLHLTTNLSQLLKDVDNAKDRTTLTDYLQAQPYYRKHKQLKKPRQTSMLQTKSLGTNFFMDTFTVTQLSGANNRIKYILVVVDGFSNLLSCALLKAKNVSETKKALDHILSQLKRNNLLAFSSVIGCDQDATYFSKEITLFLEEKYSVYCYKLRGPKKAFLAEVYGKIVMQRIYRHLTQTKKKRYIEAFDQMILSINRKKHKKLNMMAPIDINLMNQETIQQHNTNRYDKAMAKKKKKLQKDLKVGDIVLLQSPLKLFFKAYRGQFDPSFKYKIVNVKNHQTVTRYRLLDMQDGQEMSETYYRSSLQLIKEE
jgi:hypothetical protein